MHTYSPLYKTSVLKTLMLVYVNKQACNSLPRILINNT